MAGSRIHKVGDIFTRTTGLIRSGALKPEDRPIWYDVYEAFPPLQSPTYERAKPNISIKQIFYPEDLIRAKFYRKYGSPGLINLDESRSSKRPSICESFVAAYQEIESTQTGLSQDQLMLEAEAALEKIGIYPDRTRRPRSVASAGVEQASEESLEEVLETRSAITSAVLPGDILKKINFKDLISSSKSSDTSSETSVNKGALSASNISASSSSSSSSDASLAGSKETKADTSPSNTPVKEENKDGSGSST